MWQGIHDPAGQGLLQDIPMRRATLTKNRRVAKVSHFGDQGHVGTSPIKDMLVGNEDMLFLCQLKKDLYQFTLLESLEGRTLLAQDCVDMYYRLNQFISDNLSKEQRKYLAIDILELEEVTITSQVARNLMKDLDRANRIIKARGY